MKYFPPFGSTDPNASYVDRDTPNAVAGSKVPAKAIEHAQRELDHLIEHSGQTPDETDLEQVRKAVQFYARYVETSDGLTPWLYLSDAGQQPQNVATGVITPCTPMRKALGNIEANAWGNLGNFTVPVGMGGIWVVQSRTNLLGEAGEEKQITLDAVVWTDTALAAQTGSSNVTSLFTLIPAAEGQVIQLRYRHHTGVTRQSANCHAIFARLT